MTKPALPATSHFDALSKHDLMALCDRLLLQDAEATAQCVAFMEAETFGVGHGRARAKMGRRLKHCGLTADQQVRLVRAVLVRLASGRFSEQFKDQLRLALHLDPASAFAMAQSCRRSPQEYVRRYAAWVLAHQEP